MKTNFEQSYEKLDHVDGFGDRFLSKCSAAVLSRKFILCILGVSIILLFFLLSSVNLKGRELQNTTWEEYIADCGRNVRLSDPDRAKKNFETKYAKNIVNWEGVFLKRLQVAGIHLKMNPSDARSEMADISLTIPQSLSSENMTFWTQMTQGDVLKFKAYLVEMADESHYHHLEAINVISTGRKVDISSISVINNSGNAPSVTKGPESIHINFIPS